jgi:hypothetical protein
MPLSSSTGRVIVKLTRGVPSPSIRLLAIGAAAFVAWLLVVSSASAEHYVYERDGSAEGGKVPRGSEE